MGSHAMPGRPTPLIPFLRGVSAPRAEPTPQVLRLFALIKLSFGRSTIHAPRISRAGRVLALTMLLDSAVWLDLYLL
jgi:hypothetical protein